MQNSNNKRFEPSSATIQGDNADIYFARTLEILQAENVNPHVTMEVFCRRHALLAGMNEVRSLLEKVLPSHSEVWGLKEGAEISPREVVLRIRAPYQAFALYETAYLGILAHETGWATAAREVVNAAAPIPVIRGSPCRYTGIRHNPPCPHPLPGGHSSCRPGVRSLYASRGAAHCTCRYVQR